MNKCTIALACSVILALGACSDEPGNEQMTEVPVLEAASAPPAPATQAPPARVDLQEVPAPAEDDEILDDVIDNTGA
jgi:hypothetical protein